MSSRVIAAIALVAMSGCGAPSAEKPVFPKAHRPVSAIVGNSFSTEDARDRLGEANEVIRLSGLRPGMSVADVGAGEGYYTVRLSPAVGPRGRVLAEDIVPKTRDLLLQRVQRENLDNVAVRLGDPEDPKLPAESFDRIYLVHMYHEVASPYEFLWHLREGLRPNGQVIVVDAHRPTNRHGIPSELLTCEFAALGFKRLALRPLTGGDSYYASFAMSGPRPQPSAIIPCRLEQT